MLVADIMTTHVAKCTEDVSLESVYELMQNFDHGFVVVIDSEVHKVPIGIVTEHSICRQVIARGRHPRDLAAGNVLDARIARIDENAPVTDCARVFDSDNNNIIMVVNGKREFRGIVFKDAFIRVQNTVPQLAAPASAPSSPGTALGWT